MDAKERQARQREINRVMVLVEKDLKGLNTIGVLDHDIPPMLKRIKRHLQGLRPAALVFPTPETFLSLIRQQPGLTAAQFGDLLRAILPNPLSQRAQANA